LAVRGLHFDNVYDSVEQIGLPVLATKITANDVIVAGEMRLAVFAPIDAMCIQINVVVETHGSSKLGDQFDVHSVDVDFPLVLLC